MPAPASDRCRPAPWAIQSSSAHSSGHTCHFARSRVGLSWRLIPSPAPCPEGALADWLGVRQSFLLPMACYAFVLWYGLRFARPTDLPGART